MKYTYGDWETIAKDYEQIESMSTKPDSTKFHRYNENDIIDENKTVKWNREEIIRRNDTYKAEKARLQAVRNEALCSIINDIKEVFSDELSTYHINSKKSGKEIASLIYNKAYEDSYSYGIYDVLQKMDDYMDFIYELFT
jgi:hypothetical protein